MGTGERQPEELATRLAEMARDLVAQETLQGTLDRIVASAVELVDGCEASGILTVRRGRVRTIAATDNVARASDHLQGELWEGPCIDAYNHGEQLYRVADLATGSDRWPRYLPGARELGIASMIAFLLFTDADSASLGALNVYSSRSGALTDRSEQVGWLLASHAAVAFAGARNEAELREAVATRQEIGEALGIIMERHKLDDQEAFALLSRASQNSNVKARDLAADIVRTGEIPTP